MLLPSKQAVNVPKPNNKRPGEIILAKFACIRCGSNESRTLFSATDFDNSKEEYEVCSCSLCGLTQTFPMPDLATLDQYYSSSYYGGRSSKFIGIIEYLTVLACRVRAKQIHGLVSTTLPPGRKAKALDIGCGRANLLKQLSKRGFECIGVERANFKDPGHHNELIIHRQEFGDLRFQENEFDAVIIWHVLEHMNQPLETLDEVSRITRSGGIVVIAVPNMSSRQARWFKSKWFHLDIPRHLFHFSAQDLCQEIENRGFTIQSLNTFTLEQNPFGLIQSAMNHLSFLGKPNRFYQLLGYSTKFSEKFELSLWLLLSTMLLPFALLEYVISGFQNKGACLALIARKTRPG